jgi:beta-glucosidase
MKINLGVENPINYQKQIAQLKGIDKVIFVGGISPALEGEEMPVKIDGFKGGDRTNIELPKVQRDYLKALKDAGKKVIYVNCSGSAIALTPETKNVEAILQAWYPGQEGGTAVAEVLYGDYNPGGKLPVTFYKSTSQLPDFEDYSMKGRTYRYFEDALFPFGYGLSYTLFNIGDGKASKTNILPEETVQLTIPVANVGKKDGSETVQVYVKKDGDTEGPIKTLRAFKKVNLKVGESKNVEIELGKNAFEFFDNTTNTVRTTPGLYHVWYGTSSFKQDLKEIDITIEK